tara:strand:- start:53 stop:952 length:900 start_codon:yes stop_codon:yes gene_type:complete
MDEGDSFIKMESIYKNERLSKYSWFNLGGPAKLFYKIHSMEDLKKILKLKMNNGLNLHILGAGSNTLFRDGGFNGAVIKLGKEFSFIKLLKDDEIEVGASTMDRKISDFASENSIAGFEFLSCIPGSIGGSIIMNSGCYGEDISKVFLSLKAMKPDGKIEILNKENIKFFYRGNNIDKELIILSTILKGKKSEKNKILDKKARLIKKKKESQPSQVKTCGSTFKNPENKKAWELIKLSDCLDISVGDASISHKHNNFFLNNGSASASDIESLIKKVQDKVYKKTGTKLELEIKIVGEFK